MIERSLVRISANIPLCINLEQVVHVLCILFSDVKTTLCNKNVTEFQMVMFLLCYIGRGYYEMMGVVCLSVCLSHAST